MDFIKVYRSIISTIGKGTYGTVYLCKNSDNGEFTILKEIKVSLKGNAKSSDAENEIKIIADLRNPNIIRYYQNFWENDHVYILMEYASGGNLAEYMYKRKLQHLPENEILFFFAQILLGVKYIHSKNIIHRDLKAENILLAGKNGMVVKIGDFGIARILLSDQKAQTVIGTPYYLAPELCDGKPYDTKTDIWALGCLLYEMCENKRAFESETLTGLVRQITLGNVKPINAKAYSRGMQDLIDCLLSVLPEKRPTIEEALGKKVILKIIVAVYVDAGRDDMLFDYFKRICTKDHIITVEYAQ